MYLRLIREPSHQQATLGALYIDAVWTCWTLEDTLREVVGDTATWKVPGRTAIPAGLYVVRVTWSPKFQRLLPLIEDVPGFTGIRIHAGNRPEDTEGCVLVGFQRANAVILQSRPAIDAIVAQLGFEAHELLIENPSRLVR